MMKIIKYALLKKDEERYFWHLFKSWSPTQHRLGTLASITIFWLVHGPGDWGSIPGWVIPKTQKMALDSALLNTQ